jgi:hypothetical protein
METRSLRKFHTNLGLKWLESKASPQTLPIRNEVADLIHLLQEIYVLCRYFRMYRLRRRCAVKRLCPLRIQADRQNSDNLATLV